MKNNNIKVLSSVYPSEPLPFNEWMKFVYKANDKNAKAQVSGSTTSKQPADFNEWANQIYNTKN
jgi:hypothetical protein